MSSKRRAINLVPLLFLLSSMSKSLLFQNIVVKFHGSDYILCFYDASDPQSPNTSLGFSILKQLSDSEFACLI